MHLRRPTLDELFTGVIAICALAMTLMAAQRHFSKPLDPTRPTVRKDWRTFADGAKRFGSANATVQIIVFSDFQCPFCRQLAASLAKAVASRPNDVQVVYRNFPLQGIHPKALEAALVAECAAQYGRFKEMHDLLFQLQDSLPRMQLILAANRVGIQDSTGFASCVRSAKAREQVRIDSLAGSALKVTGTPTLLINRWLLAGAPSYPVLDSLITRTLEEKR